MRLSRKNRKKANTSIRGSRSILVRELEMELEVLNMAFSEDSLACDFDDWPAGGVEVGVVFAVTLTRDGEWCRQLLAGAALGEDNLD